MSDWSAGYVADVGYTFGYYAELNPLRIKLAFLNNGLVYPECGTACELGFGQGLSTNIHAAASTTQWHGTDFSPAQAGFAQSLASICDNGAKLYDDSFAEFLTRTDLPDFDYIGLHGIWSWISDENRALIVEFIKRKLKVGGVVYVSYNTLPGWAGFSPMRHLMVQHAEIIGSQGQGTINRVDGAIKFVDALLATDPTFLRANPLLNERIAKLKDQDRQYLAHEYFNKDWHPIYFASMAEWLEPAKLQYACSAHYLDHVDPINLTASQQEFLKDIPEAIFRESVRDFMVNQQFRRDYWVKGLRRLSTIEQTELLNSLSIVLLAPRNKIALQVNGTLGQASLSPHVYNPILDFLADHQPKSIAQINAHAVDFEIPFAQLIQAIMILAGAGQLTIAQDEATCASRKEHTDKLNSFTMQKAKASVDFNYLASPVIAGGVSVSSFSQLFLLAMQDGLKEPEQLANYVWEALSRMDRKMTVEGKVLESREKNIAHLMGLAVEFLDIQLPILKTLKVI